MPFNSLSNYELSIEYQSVRDAITEKLDNNRFIEFMQSYKQHNLPPEASLPEGSQYYDISEFNTQFGNNENKLSIMHFNVRRIARNRGNLIALLETLNIKLEIIVLTEIGDDADAYINDVNFPDYDSYIDVPLNNKYGGTAILVRKGLGRVSSKDDLRMSKNCTCNKCAFENNWISVYSKGVNYIIGAIYRHPNGDVSHFINSLECSLEKIPPQQTCLLIGDMNIDLLKIDQNMTFDYYTTLTSYNFLPYITTPTRVTDTTATLIDHVFLRVNNKLRNVKLSSGVLFSDITDHLPCFMIIDISSNNDKNERPYIRIFSERNISNFKNSLAQINWEEVLNAHDVSQNCTNFYEKIHTLYNTNFPLIKQSRKRSKDKKWLSGNLKACIRKKHQLYVRQLKSPTTNNIQKYKTYKNILTSCIHEAEGMYHQKLFSDKQSGILNFWKTYSQTLNPIKKSNKNHLEKLIVNGQTLTRDIDIANGFNDYFCSVGEKISSKIKATGNFNSYMKYKTDETFFLMPVVATEVLNEMLKLNPQKACGPDNITTKLIKTCADELKNPLTHLFNAAIASAQFPDPWKIAKVLSLYKKKSKYFPENYRPISLLNCFGKILEKLVYKQMIKFIEKHKILYLYQYGFRKNYSTCLALIDIVDKIKNALDQNDYVMGIFLDITKAFDSINHGILYSKLEHYGFRGHSLDFIRSYLTNRKQFTWAQGISSEIKGISYGVPQGSILGPLLFLIYINDIQYTVKNREIRLFADDTGLFIQDKEPHKLIQKGEIIMAEVVKWFKLNKLELSIGKSNFIIFHGVRKNKVDSITELKIGTETLQRSNTVKYIGVTLDECLSWDQHIDSVCSSLVKYFSVFYNIRNSMNRRIVRIIYYACIHSRIKYGIEVYGAASNTKIRKLQILQNKLLKVLTKSNYRHSTDKLHKDLDILKLKDIYKSSLLHFVYNCVKGSPIDPFKNYFTHRSDQHDYNLRNNDDLTRRNVSLNMGQSTTHYTGATLWNDLPDNLTDIKTIGSFKRGLKNHFLQNYM